MEIKKAIGILVHLRDDLNLSSEEYIECFNEAISALEKQVGKKPLQACGHATELFKKDIPLMQYCPICGQRIDWPEPKED